VPAAAESPATASSSPSSATRSDASRPYRSSVTAGSQKYSSAMQKQGRTAS
jgi:hypothetical protein